MISWLSPVGGLAIETKNGTITRLRFVENASEEASSADSLAAQCIAELQEYFSGKRIAFDLPLAPKGTPFQKEVWRAAQAIPYGETRTYAQLAVMIGRPNAARAVGNALKQNPIAILIPCHRIIPSNGSLGGYAWGMKKKEALLALEHSAH